MGGRQQHAAAACAKSRGVRPIREDCACSVAADWDESIQHTETLLAHIAPQKAQLGRRDGPVTSSMTST